GLPRNASVGPAVRPAALHAAALVVNHQLTLREGARDAAAFLDRLALAGEQAPAPLVRAQQLPLVRAGRYHVDRDSVAHCTLRESPHRRRERTVPAAARGAQPCPNRVRGPVFRFLSRCPERPMLDPIRTFGPRNIAIDIDSGGAHGRPAPGAQEKLHGAACALLLELAHADDEFADIERTHIEAVLQRHFGLEPRVAKELMELAEYERANAIDLFQFTTLIRNNYDLGQKTLLAEIMWGLVLTDGQIARHESYMLRKIASLLDLEPGYLATARRRVEEPEA